MIDIDEMEEMLAPELEALEKKPTPIMVRASNPNNLDDRALLEKAMAAENGDKFRRLWAGDASEYGGDESARDLALCALLAFWFDRDPVRIERVVRSSGCMRPKWDEQRGDETYGERTVRVAVEGCTETYTPASNYSAVSKVGVPAETKFRWRTAAEIVREAPAVALWVATWWLALGALTELVAKIKAGKTTWLLALVRAVLDGAEFMGQPTMKTPVLYLTEQRQASFSEQLKTAGLDDYDGLHVLYHHEVRGVAWAVVIDEVVRKAEAEGAKLIIVDTLSPFAGIRGDAENSAGAALEALEPLQYAASRGIAVCVVRHERKGGGEVGDSGRGNSAFSGGVDIVLNIKRAEGQVRASVRVIHALSRFEDTPTSLVIERTPGGYVALGSQATVAANEARAALLKVFESEGGGFTLDELAKVTPESVKRTAMQAALDALIEEGVVTRTGEGKKGDPYRHSAGVIHSAGTPNSNRRKETNPIEGVIQRAADEGRLVL